MFLPPLWLGSWWLKFHQHSVPRHCRSLPHGVPYDGNSSHYSLFSWLNPCPPTKVPPIVAFSEILCSFLLRSYFIPVAVLGASRPIPGARLLVNLRSLLDRKHPDVKGIKNKNHVPVFLFESFWCLRQGLKLGECPKDWIMHCKEVKCHTARNLSTLLVG